MLLNFWLASTGASIAVDAISYMAMAEKLKKEGYERKKEENQSITEKTYYVLSTIAHAWWTAFPILNLAVSINLLSKEGMDNLLRKAKSSGAFVKSYDAMTIEERFEELARRERKIDRERKELEALKNALIAEQNKDADASLENEGYSRSFS